MASNIIMRTGKRDNDKHLRATNSLMAIAGILLLLAAMGFKKKAFEITVLPVFDGRPLVPDSSRYVSEKGDTLVIEAFRFYVGNFCFYKKGRRHRLDHSYYLIDASKPQSQNISLAGLSASFDSLAVTIGVDSTASVSGALSGVLDPAAGMYWAWNTGYINAKLEGRSRQCPALHNAFEFHIGGYRAPYKACRVVMLKPGNTAGKSSIIIEADAARMLKNIKLSEKNSVVIPGKDACMIADNYAGMLSIKQ